MKLLVIIFASMVFTSTFAQNQFSEADAHKVVNIFLKDFINLIFRKHVPIARIFFIREPKHFFKNIRFLTES